MGREGLCDVEDEKAARSTLGTCSSLEPSRAGRLTRARGEGCILVVGHGVGARGGVALASASNFGPESGAALGNDGRGDSLGTG